MHPIVCVCRYTDTLSVCMVFVSCGYIEVPTSMHRKSLHTHIVLYAVAVAILLRPLPCSLAHYPFNTHSNTHTYTANLAHIYAANYKNNSLILQLYNFSLGTLMAS